jgi:hypothetical protein
MTNEQLRDFLDLAGWTERRGVASVKFVICPYCDRKFSPVPPGRYYCETPAGEGCERAFEVKVMHSPMGRAWLTQELPERKEVPGTVS